MKRILHTLLFTNQFRYPTIKEEDGWILELTAGTLETNDNPKKRARKEVEEEIGYKITQLEFINSFFVSPGGTSERVFLYYSEVNLSDKVFDGGGMKYENEDIELIKIKTNDLIDTLENNQFRDAKTIIGIQWFLNHKI